MDVPHSAVLYTDCCQVREPRQPQVVTFPVNCLNLLQRLLLSLVIIIILYVLWCCLLSNWVFSVIYFNYCYMLSGLLSFTL